MKHGTAKWALAEVEGEDRGLERKSFSALRAIPKPSDHLTVLGIPTLWARTRGAGVKVAVLDSGVAHLDNVFTDIVRLDHEGIATNDGDNSGHGTPCATLIASQQPSAMGVAPDASIVSYCVSGPNGLPTADRIIRALAKAVEQGCDIVSCSFVVEDASPELLDAARGAIDAGLVVVASSGNILGKVASFPEEVDDVIVVGAVGKTTRPLVEQRLGAFTDVFAPGFPLRHIDRLGHVSSDFGQTSGATALVSGTIALGLSLCPPAARTGIARRMGELITETATQLPQASPAAPNAGFLSPSALLARIAVHI